MDGAITNTSIINEEEYNVTTYTQPESTNTGVITDYTTEWTTSATTDFYSDPDISLTPKEYALLSTYLSMAILGLVFNSLTLIIIGHGKNTSKEIKPQLINLAIADLLMALFDPLKQVSILLRYLPFPGGIHLCRLYIFIKHAAHYASPLCNAAISLERFVIIFFPFRASRYTEFHKTIVIIAIWLCATLPGVRYLVHAELFSFGQIHSCITRGFLFSPNIDYWINTLQYIFPACIIFVAYFATYTKLCLKKSSGVKRHLSAQWKKDLEKVSFIYDFTYFHL